MEGLTGDWFPWLHLTDLDGELSLDIAIGDSSAHVSARSTMRWNNVGDEYFEKAP